MRIESPRWVPLGDVADVFTGATPSRNQPGYWNGTIPWVTTGGIDFNVITEATGQITERALNETSVKVFKAGTLLMAMYGQGATRGKVARLGIDAATNQACAAIVPKDADLSVDYLYQVLAHGYERVRGMSNSGGQANLSTNIIRKISLPWVSNGRQVEIAGTLECWDRSSQLAVEHLQKLRLRRLALAEFLTRPRSQWACVPIRQFAVASGMTNFGSRALPVMSCTKHFGLIDASEVFGKRIHGADLAKYKVVRRGEFAYATNHIEEGSIGLQQRHDEALVSPMYTVFSVDETKVHSRFLILVLKTERLRRTFEALTHSSVDRRGSLRWPHFSRIKVPLPPMAEQAEIVAIADRAGDEIRLAEQQIELLRRQKQALLRKLLWSPAPGAKRTG